MVIIAGTGRGLIGLMRTGRQDKYTTIQYNIPISSLPGTEPSVSSSCFLVTVSNQRRPSPSPSPVVLLLDCSQFSPDDILESVTNVVLITVKSI